MTLPTRHRRFFIEHSPLYSWRIFCVIRANFCFQAPARRRGKCATIAPFAQFNDFEGKP